MALLLLFLLGAMAVSFLCSILEATLMSTPISYITMREEEGYKPATRFKEYKQDPSRAIAAILSLNTIANTIGAAGVGSQATRLFGSQWFGLVSALMTILILVFSEIIPKTLGTTRWKSLMGFATVMIRGLIFLMYPLVLLIELLSGLITPEDAEEPAVSRDEVSAMANVAEEEGDLEEDENTIIQNLISMDEVKAFDVMTPRVVCEIAPESMTIKAFYKSRRFRHHSRIPVYANDDEYIYFYSKRDNRSAIWNRGGYIYYDIDADNNPETGVDKEIPGLEVNIPEGAFYLFPKCSSFYGKSDGEVTINNSTDFAMYLLEKGHVATVGGDAFGDPDCFRMSYATSDENIVEAMTRIKNTVEKLK